MNTMEPLNPPFVVRGWNKSGSGQNSRVSASVDGHDLYFQGPGLQNAPESGDGFLAVSLLPAMYQNRPLDLRGMPPVSTGLLQSVEQLQDIWCSWNAELHRVPVLANEDVGEPGSGNLTFFSGGVDAVHTVVAAGEEAGKLVLVNGFDFSMDLSQFATTRDRVGKLAAKLGHEFETVESNWIDHTRRQRIARSTSHGGCLVAIGHLLHPAQATIASSYSWACMFPWGSHPMLDHHWTTRNVRITHASNDMSRLEKIAILAQQPGLLGQIWVCHKNPIANCGKCKKCLRTMAMLKLVNGDASAFPAYQGDVVDAWLKNTVEESDFLQEITCFAAATQNRELAQVAAKGRRAVMRRQTLRRLWRLLFPARAERVDYAQDLRPWGRGPRPEF